MALLEALAVRRVLGGTLGWLVEHPWQALALATCALLAWWHFVTIPALEASVAREVAAHKETKVRFQSAMLEAEQRHNEARLVAEATYMAMAENTDAQIETVRGDAMAAAERYIADNRVRCDAREAAAGATSRAAAPAPDPGAPRGDRSSPATELVAVETEDVRICTENTIRLEAARDWGIGLGSLEPTP